MAPYHVLVTGGSGFIAGHCILTLLEAGHRVRATLRDLGREPEVRRILEETGMPTDSPLGFVQTDLMQDTGWVEALEGVDFVLHVASPVHPGHLETEDDVIVPARAGTLRVLRAARAARVRRVVLTSAFHAVSWGHPRGNHLFTEADWTIPDGPGADAYARSKTFAEQAAWDFVKDAAGPELVTMLPVAVMGPVLGTGISGANHIVHQMLTGAMPFMPDLHIPIVDVRDVACAHLLAMAAPEAASQRFLLSNGPALPMRDIAAVLRAAAAGSAHHIPRRVMPNAVMHLIGLFNPQVRAILPDLGQSKRTSNEKAARLLGWSARAPAEAIAAAAESMIRKSLL
ncbi:NAD-dependent epimerase/dehydratase family protein [Xinfangfangia pollutisoli]|uniref:NAD-dependent epimerase/dehydratase family protein n=1 Tax=Xinfangfangia pollutisoli TaxID=2865960 RepID=UPI001CD4E6B9|nr:NAD-dependent epimerase/dehydratase family protein [Xinfangfangia pollutisoli]